MGRLGGIGYNMNLPFHLNPATLIQIFQPNFSPGASDQVVLQAYRALLNLIQECDQNGAFLHELTLLDESGKEVDAQQTLIKWLNRLCSRFHRLVVRRRILEVIKGCKGVLKSLPVAEDQPILSKWTKPEQPAFLRLFQNLTEGSSSMRYLDKLFIREGQLRNIDLYLLKANPKYLMAKVDFEESLTEERMSLSKSEKYFLGVIAASVYGCDYLWRLCAEQFIKASGNPNWLRLGVGAATPLMQTISKLSYLIAFDFPSFTRKAIFKGKTTNNLEAKRLLSCLLVLGYYQSLACLCLSVGIIPEPSLPSINIPELHEIVPTSESFEIMKTREELTYGNELLKAQRFSRLYAFDRNSDEESEESPVMIKRVEVFKDQATKSSGVDEEKFRKLKTILRIRSIYGKFVTFEDQTISGPLTSTETDKSQTESSSEDLVLSEDNQHLSSQWNFNDHAVNTLSRIYDVNFVLKLTQMLDSMHSLSPERRSFLKPYYESIHDYIHEYVKYSKLMKKQITPAEMSYLKLITRSPFLFEQKSFQKMCGDLVASGHQNPYNFIIETVSYKLELTTSIFCCELSRFEDNQDFEDADLQQS